MKKIYLTAVSLLLAACGMSCKTEVRSVDVLTAPVDPSITIDPPGPEWSTRHIEASPQATEQHPQK